MNITKRTSPPFRFDTVGSFIRPERLRKAKEAFKAGDISEEELHTVEDSEIKELVSRAEKAGLQCVGDGEYRREYWHLDFLWKLNGITEIYDEKAKRAYASKNTVACLEDRISCGKHPFLEDYKFLKDVAGNSILTRMNIPSPTQCVYELTRPSKRDSLERIYGKRYNLMFDDVVDTYTTFINNLYDIGCRCLQLDDCTWCYLCNEQWLKEAKEETGADQKTILNQMLELTNTITKKIPQDMAVVEHVCCGPYHKEWNSMGGYTKIAPLLFPNLKVDGIHLKFDEGPLEPLQYVPDDIMVSLGIVDAKSESHEEYNNIVSFIERAEKYHPLNMLGINTQCGFASSESSITMSDELQWKKIELMRKVALDVWA